MPGAPLEGGSELGSNAAFAERREASRLPARREEAQHRRRRAVLAHAQDAGAVAAVAGFFGIHGAAFQGMEDLGGFLGDDALEAGAKVGFHEPFYGS